MQMQRKGVPALLLRWPLPVPDDGTLSHLSACVPPHPRSLQRLLPFPRNSTTRLGLTMLIPCASALLFYLAPFPYETHRRSGSRPPSPGFSKRTFLSTSLQSNFFLQCRLHCFSLLLSTTLMWLTRPLMRIFFSFGLFHVAHRDSFPTCTAGLPGLLCWVLSSCSLAVGLRHRSASTSILSPTDECFLPWRTLPSSRECLDTLTASSAYSYP